MCVVSCISTSVLLEVNIFKEAASKKRRLIPSGNTFMEEMMRQQLLPFQHPQTPCSAHMPFATHTFQESPLQQNQGFDVNFLSGCPAPVSHHAAPCSSHVMITAPDRAATAAIRPLQHAPSLQPSFNAVPPQTSKAHRSVCSRQNPWCQQVQL